MRGFISVLLGVVAVSSGAASEGGASNHCHDQQTNQRWEELATQNHGSDPIQRLYALRLGLCVQVERSVLSVPRATTIFERQREKVLRNLKDQRPSEPHGA